MFVSKNIIQEKILIIQFLIDLTNILHTVKQKVQNTNKQDITHLSQNCAIIQHTSKMTNLCNQYTHNKNVPNSLKMAHYNQICATSYCNNVATNAEII